MFNQSSVNHLVFEGRHQRSKYENLRCKVQWFISKAGGSLTESCNDAIPHKYIWLALHHHYLFHSSNCQHFLLQYFPPVRRKPWALVIAKEQWVLSLGTRCLPAAVSVKNDALVVWDKGQKKKRYQPKLRMRGYSLSGSKEPCPWGDR